MGRLNGKVAIVTGAGRGLGREHALQLAAEGAAVVVNDLGGGLHGEAEFQTPAQEVVAEIKANGGRGIADASDISDFDAAQAMVDNAVKEFGGVDILINNAGILRDRMLVNMSAEEWDQVIKVHLRGHFCPARAVAGLWRANSKTDPESAKQDKVIISTTSVSGLFGSPGQTNYTAAKAGIAMFSYDMHLELNERLGVRTYAIAPGARTRLTESSPAAVDQVAAPDSGFDFYDPANVSPFLVWLASPGCPAPSGTIYAVEGDEVTTVQHFTRAQRIKAGDKAWDLESLDANASALWA